MAGRYGTIPSNLSIGASQSVRRNSGDSAFETFTPFVLPADPNADRILFWDDSAGSAEWLTLGTGLSITGTTINAATGITIGSTPISSGTNDRILFQSGGVVSQDADLKFDGSNLILGNGTKHCEIGVDSSYNVIFGHAYAASDNVAQYQFKYFQSGGYGAAGLALIDTGYGYTTVINQVGSGTLYWTDGASMPGTLMIGAIENPGDSTKFIASYGNWYITGTDLIGFGEASTAAKLHVKHTTEQMRLAYDSSNYISTTVSSAGVVSLNAVGSGARFEFNDEIRNVYDSTHYAKHTVNSSSEYDIEAVGPSTTGQIKLLAGTNFIAVNASGAADTITLQAPYINIGVSGVDQILIGDSASETQIVSNVIMMANLPTSDPSNPGQLWNDGGKIMVSI